MCYERAFGATPCNASPTRGAGAVCRTLGQAAGARLFGHFIPEGTARPILLLLPWISRVWEPIFFPTNSFNKKLFGKTSEDFRRILESTGPSIRIPETLIRKRAAKTLESTRPLSDNQWNTRPSVLEHPGQIRWTLTMLPKPDETRRSERRAAAPALARLDPEVAEAKPQSTPHTPAKGELREEERRGPTSAS